MTRPPHQGEYGFDGNMIGLVGMIAVAFASLTAAVALALTGFVGAAARIAALVVAPLLTTLGIYLHTTRRGKFLVWAEILDRLRLRGDERVLDVGCGRGAVLTMVARCLPRGVAVGIDLWTSDQSGNGTEAAERNLIVEGVRERCNLVTGDMRSMPFPDASFDKIVSSLAIHNIRDLAGRSRAIEEVARVLAPGGHVAIADLAWTRVYARRLEALGFIDVRRCRLGWRFWWGPAFPATALVTGTKPGRSN
jgi:arsenite methyltransferase